MDPPTECMQHPYPPSKLPLDDSCGQSDSHDDNQKKKTVLARVQQFLPQIEQSNAELLQRDPRNVDIEHIEETDERVIEMASVAKSLSLGLLT
jgi:Domain of unknown function (DUF4598)